MEGHNSSPNPILSFYLFFCQILSFVIAGIETASEFRAWTAWGIGVLLAFVQFMVHRENFVKAVRKTFKRK